jgi:hypothetical protein
VRAPISLPRANSLRFTRKRAQAQLYKGNKSVYYFVTTPIAQRSIFDTQAPDFKLRHYRRDRGRQNFGYIVVYLGSVDVDAGRRGQMTPEWIRVWPETATVASPFLPSGIRVLLWLDGRSNGTGLAVQQQLLIE